MAQTETERLLSTIQGITREANRLKHDVQAGHIGGGWQQETLRSLAGYLASAQKQVS